MTSRLAFLRTGTDPVRAITSNKIHRYDCPRIKFTPDERLDDDLEVATDICHSCYSSPRAEFFAEKYRIQAILDKQLRAEAKARLKAAANGVYRRTREHRRREPGHVVTAGYGSGLHVGWSPDGMKVAARLSEDHDSNWLEASIKAWERA